MQRYFINQPAQLNQSLELPTDVAHHFSKVMRAKPGDQAEFVSSTGDVFIGQLTRTSGSQAWVSLNKQLETDSELSVKVTLACGVPKGEKAQLIVQKATELGVHEIIFFDAQRSVSRWSAERRSKKIAKLAKIAQGAAEQSHRNVVPKISYQERLTDLVATDYFDYRVVAWEESAKQGEHSNLSQVFHQLTIGDTLLAIIGPEGGLTDEEVRHVNDQGVVSVGLGPRILRTETAPLYLLAAISYYFELEQWLMNNERKFSRA